MSTDGKRILQRTLKHLLLVQSNGDTDALAMALRRLNGLGAWSEAKGKEFFHVEFALLEQGILRFGHGLSESVACVETRLDIRHRFGIE